QLAPDVFADVISALLENEEVRKNGHDLKSLILVLATLGLKVAGLEGDVELLSYLLNPSRREHALPDLAPERLHAARPGHPTISAARKKPCPLVDVTVDQCAACYGAYADAAGRLAEALWKEIDQSGLSKLAREIELPLIPVLARMERKGVKIDIGVLDRMEPKVDAECQERLVEIHRHAGHAFNVNSNSQLAEVLYQELKLAVLKRGKTGPSTDQEVLEKLAEQHPMPRALIDYRALSKLK